MENVFQAGSRQSYHLAVAHSWVVVARSQQHIVQGFLHTRVGCLAELNVVWKCSVQV